MPVMLCYRYRACFHRGCGRPVAGNCSAQLRQGTENCGMSISLTTMCIRFSIAVCCLFAHLSVCFTLLQYMCVCFLASHSYLFICSVSWSVTLSLVNQSHCPTVVCLLFRCVWSSLFLCLDLPLPACLPVCLSPSVCLYVCLSVSFSQP